jgi:hypothetical protein
MHVSSLQTAPFRGTNLEALYRTKTLVVTVYSTTDGFRSAARGLLPDLCCFRRVQVDIIIAQATADAMSECSCCVATLLSDQQTRSLQSIQLRILRYWYNMNKTQENFLDLVRSDWPHSSVRASQLVVPDSTPGQLCRLNL